MIEIFICKTAYRKGDTQRSISCGLNAKNNFQPWYENYEICGFQTEDFDVAKNHVDALEGGNLSCWIESHEDGDFNKPILREIHGSDYGGIYVRDYTDGK